MSYEAYFCANFWLSMSVANVRAAEPPDTLLRVVCGGVFRSLHVLRNDLKLVAKIALFQPSRGVRQSVLPFLRAT